MKHNNTEQIGTRLEHTVVARMQAWFWKVEDRTKILKGWSQVRDSCWPTFDELALRQR